MYNVFALKNNNKLNNHVTATQIDLRKKKKT